MDVELVQTVAPVLLELDLELHLGCRYGFPDKPGARLSAPDAPPIIPYTAPGPSATSAARPSTSAIAPHRRRESGGAAPQEVHLVLDVARTNWQVTAVADLAASIAAPEPERFDVRENTVAQLIP